MRNFGTTEILVQKSLKLVLLLKRHEDLKYQGLNCKNRRSRDLFVNIEYLEGFCVTRYGCNVLWMEYMGLCVKIQGLFLGII
jgi:hypothetical protein